MNLNPLIVYFIITKACNLACLHCIRSNTSNKVYVEGEAVMSTVSAMKAMSVINDFYPNSTLVITGGEPTLHPDFFCILEKACMQYKRVVLASNGLFSNNVLEKLVLLSKNKNFHIQISLDGDKHTHNQIRGEGCFEKTFKRITELCALCREKSVSISTTVNALNIDSIFNLAYSLRNLSLYRWRLSPEQIFNKNSFGRQIFPSEWNKFVDEILQICSFRVSIRKIFDFALMDKLLDTSINHRNIRCNCGFARSKMYISPNFDVLLCTCMPHIKIGNILDMDMETINKHMLANNPVCLEDSICKTCKYLRVCNGGCVGYSFYYQGKIGLGDIRCPKIQENLKDGKCVI